MKTPAEKYQNDPHYRHLVDTLEHAIHQAQFTPSEVREAAMLACIRFESHQPPRPMRLGPTDGVETARLSEEDL